MRVTIDRNGTLIVTAENSLEDYALTRWYAECVGPDGAISMESVQIQINQEGDSNG